jgi:hypothetical protein
LYSMGCPWLQPPAVINAGAVNVEFFRKLGASELEWCSKVVRHKVSLRLTNYN